MNSVSILGTITRDIELKETSTGVKYTRFGIAVNRTTKDEEGKYIADFFNVVAWRKTAELIKNYFGKGKRIAINGKLQTSKYTDNNGVERTSVEIVANEVHIIEKKETKEEKEEVKEDPMSDEVFSEFGDSIEITDDEVAF